MYSRKLALTQARQYRSCPPPEIASDPAQAEYMQQHLSICPHCGAAESSRLEIWQDLGSKLKEFFSAGQPAPGEPGVAAGQLRCLNPGLAGWRDAYFYNPPWVLVLDTTGKIADEVLVGQVYHDIGLAAPGDLVLEDARTNVGDLFVECWNTYTLKSSYLGPVMVTVTADIVAAVKDLETRPDSLPDWALLPAPLTEHDPRLYFRELEVEVGYTFASRAVSEILAAFEIPRLDYPSAGELQADIRKSAKMIRFPRRTDDPAELLASAQFPAEEFAKAAAGDERESIPANLVVLYNGKIQAFKPIQGLIKSRIRTESNLNISGVFPRIPDHARDPAMICFYWSKATGAMAPDDMHWEIGSGEFNAKFITEFQDDETLELALVYETEEK